MGTLKVLNAIGNALENFIDNLGAQMQNDETNETQQEEKETIDMCGSLKHSHWADKAPIKVGQTFPEGTVVEITKDGKTIAISKPVVWNGFARDDTLSKWEEGGWTQARLHVDGYTEGEQDFAVPKGKVIKALILEKQKVHLNIVTREAETNEEKAIHNRWPLTEAK